MLLMLAFKHIPFPVVLCHLIIGWVRLGKWIEAVLRGFDVAIACMFFFPPTIRQI